MSDSGGPDHAGPPSAGPRVCLIQQSMACEFEFFANPGPPEQVEALSDALQLVDQLEDQMTVYRPFSAMSQINSRAATGPVTVEPRLLQLLEQATRLSRELEGAFDPTAGPLVALWRQCRKDGRIPRPNEVEAVRNRVGCQHVEIDREQSTIRYLHPGVEFNLGAIGKGHALDRASELLHDRGVSDCLLHAGGSSILCRGMHPPHSGWPVGLRNPLFPEQLLATLLVRDRSLATSGNGQQFFRHRGVRYGHLLDPRTGWPADGLLSVTVLAPTATEADALSTAFFVLGVEKAKEYCHNRPEIGAILIPRPTRGRRLAPSVAGLLPEEIFWAPEVEPRVES